VNTDRWVLFFAGIMVLASVVLGVWVSEWWLILAGFVGLNMFQASMTGFCPLAKLMFRLGVKSGSAFTCSVNTAKQAQDG